MLRPIAGKPLIIHTMERARSAQTISRVIVATDDQSIAETVRYHGGEAVMTSSAHQSGSDRIAEVAAALAEGSIVVNVQGDEPLIVPETIDRAVTAMIDGDADIVTVCEPLTSLYGELLNFNVVKAVVAEDGRALYFSRSPMPFPRDASLRHGGDPNLALTEEPELFENFRKHTGLYVYRREFLLEFTKLPQTRLEKLESLEQLRALENGAVIKVVDAVGRSIGVDTEDDFERVRDLIECGVDIRPVRNEDIPDVARVHVESWQRSFEGLVPQQFLDLMSVEERTERYRNRECNGRYAMLVAEHPVAGIVGFADFGTPVLNVEADSQVFSFYFLPEFQGKGLGERLFRRCSAIMAREGSSSICLDSLEVSPYRRFYEKMGASIVGRDSHRLGDEDFATVIYGWKDIGAL